MTRAPRKKPPAKRAKRPAAAPAEQPDRVVSGGKVRLRVIQQALLPPDWEMKPGVPATRADCANVPRPCPYVSCSMHLWLILQSERPGNPKAGKQGATTLRPTSSHSCALDVAERGATTEEIADMLGMHHSRVRQIAEGALVKIFASDPVLASKLMEVF